jgi:purine-binding chemotaxis protein CheW
MRQTKDTSGDTPTRKINEAGPGVENTVGVSEEKKRILKARAKALAKEPAGQEIRQDSIGVMEFSLANERYGIESSYVREVYLMKELTSVPSTPAFVLGITSVRGRILSVIDIKKFFDLPEKGLGDLNRIIIVEAGEMELCILADVVMGVRSIALDEIQPSLPNLTGIRQEYLRGITKDQVVILDMEKFLSDKKIVVHEEIGT